MRADSNFFHGIELDFHSNLALSGECRPHSNPILFQPGVCALVLLQSNGWTEKPVPFWTLSNLAKRILLGPGYQAQEYSAFDTVAKSNAWDEKRKMPWHDWRWRPVWFDPEGRRVVKDYVEGDIYPARISFSQMEVMIEFRDIEKRRIPVEIISALRSVTSLMGNLTIGQDRFLLPGKVDHYLFNIHVVESHQCARDSEVYIF